jgi:drug/metabolite transporter superfamily protein YnfA
VVGALRARDAPQAGFGCGRVAAAHGSIVATVSFWDRQVEELRAGIAALSGAVA